MEQVQVLLSRKNLGTQRTWFEIQAPRTLESARQRKPLQKLELNSDKLPFLSFLFT